mgnify:CR=1 FL=1
MLAEHGAAEDVERLELAVRGFDDGEEALAEQSKYRDRAAERRKELDKAIKAGEADPETVAEAGMGAEQFENAESINDQEAALPAWPWARPGLARPSVW